MDKELAYKSLVETGSFCRENIRKMFQEIKIGADILEIVQSVDKKIKETKDYELLVPTTIDLNYIACNHSPTTSYKLTEYDLVSFSVSLAKKISGTEKYAHAKMSYTKPLNKMYEELTKGTAEACNAGVKACGVDVLLMDIRTDVYEILNSYGIKTLTNICGNELYDSAKIIPNSILVPDFLKENYLLLNQRMKEDEIYFVDVYGIDSSKDCEAKIFDYPSIMFGLENKKKPHRKSLLEAIDLIQKEYGKNYFSYLDFKTKFEHKTKIKLNKSILSELTKKNYISFLPSLMVPQEDPNFMNVCARFGHSVLIREDTNIILC
jgi:methionine aminopeptidase